MREVRQKPTTEFATATNSLPAEFYGKYDNLNRFKLFKWLYQHEVGNPAVRTFEELKLPAELQRNCREYVRWVQSVATTYLIFDDSNFKHWLNALRAYREMHLISQESVRVLRDELFAMLDEMETVAVKGEFENGNKILPLSFGHRPRVVVQLCHDQQTPGREHRNVLAERTADARSADVRIREEMDQDPEPVFDAHIRQRRAAAHPLFQASARDRRPAGLTPRSRCGVSPAGHKKKGEGFTTLPSKPPDVRNIVASLSSNPSNFCGRHYMQTEFFIAPFGTDTNVRHFGGRTKTEIETIRNAMF